MINLASISLMSTNLVPKRLARLLTCSLLPLVAVLALAPSVEAANCTAAPVSGQVYSIINLASGKGLDISGASTARGTQVQQWGYGGGTHQQFLLTDLGNGYWSITAKNSNLLLDVSGASANDGASVVQWSSTSGANQQWQLKQSTTGAFNIVSRNSAKSLTVADSNSGSKLYQQTDTAGGLQRWYLNPVSGTCGNSVSGFASQSGGDGLSSTTGGGTASAQTVTSCSALTAALQSTNTSVIQFNGTIDCRTASRTQVACPIACPSYQDPGKTYYRVPVGTQTCTELGSTSNATVNRTRNETSIKVKSNKTLVGLSENAKIIGASLDLSGSQNVILRNFSIENINPGLIEAGDGVTLSDSSHIWIDHVGFALISDGYTDIKNSENVTLSWNHFNGYNSAVCGNQHHYTMLIQDSQTTLHHNFFDRASGRNPKTNGLNARVHLYNNYWLDITYFAINADEAAQVKVEGNYFANSAKPHWNAGNGYINANVASNRYTGVSATDPDKDTGSTVFGDIKLYSYSLDNVDNLPSQVSAGAGPQ